jgi:hypothetical protein
MTKLICTIGLLAALALGALAGGQHRVRSYYRRDGTYVPEHYRTNPNSSRTDNWSSRGNYNPHTGEIGTVDPYKYSDDQDDGVNLLGE